MASSTSFSPSPEVEVHTFKQTGGESLKDAWYRISDSQHRSTKKYSDTILLRNFYVGITNWYRYVLDTLTGGNFLGTPSVEAYNIIESLFGTPPTNEPKTKTTMEHVVERHDILEKNLSSMNWATEVDKNLLDSTIKIE